MLLICGKLNHTKLFNKCFIQRSTNFIQFKPKSFSTSVFNRPLQRCVAKNVRASNKLLTSARNGNQLILKRIASTKPGTKLAEGRSDIARLLLLAKDEKWFLLASIGCLVISSSITMGVPYAIGRILDIIFTDAFSKERLTEFCAMLFGILLVGGFANFGRIYFMNSASKLWLLLCYLYNFLLT